MEHVTNEPWLRFLADPQRSFTPAQLRSWQDGSERLQAGEPIQYIIGQAWFRDLRLEVGPGVLIPRPETEELVEWALAEAGEETLRILDIGTGSGCIAVSLARALPEAEVTGLDLSSDALKYARRNAALHSPRVRFVQADILSDDPPPAENYHRILCNPPYVLQSDAAEMAPHVLRHEPGQALFVPDTDPLRYYIKVCAFARRHLLPGGRIYFEIHERFGAEVVDLMEKTGFTGVKLRRDLNGRDRMVRGIQPEKAPQG